MTSLAYQTYNRKAQSTLYKGFFMSSQSVNTNAWDAILSASPVVQLTLLCLVGLSIACWSIIFAKKKQFRKLKQANDSFSNLFWKADSLEAIYNDLNLYPDSSLSRLFKAGYLELQKIADSPLVEKSDDANEKKKTKLLGLDNLERVLRKTIDSEIADIENKLPLLATTGSTGPFIGLFGTVWGIMSSFQSIGATGSASLAVVAPGIAEALVATAIGLAAAIPAVVAYNHFISQLKKEEMELNNFSADFLNIVKRNFFAEE